MDKQKLDRANELNNFIEYYQTIIYRYCNDMKSAIKKALDSIQKEFDEL